MAVDYEGYEDLGRFTPAQLQSYRAMLLEKTQPQVDFIERNVPVTAGELDVIELGCGNGRLLLALSQAGDLLSGVGYDLSSSRVQFANDWARQLGSPEVDFVQADILDLAQGRWTKYINRGFDLAVCITGCFQYFYPISPSAPKKVLQFMRDSGTYALFELYKRPKMGKTWHKLPDTDPWMYLLDEYADTGDWVRHTKAFVGRDGKVDERVEDLAYYTMPVFLKHLQDAGFHNTHWAKEDDTTMVVLVS